jgi:sulfate transport system substrate-binding protein
MKNLLLIIVAVALYTTNVFSEISLLNASYDPTRELYQKINTVFTQQYNNKDKGVKASVKMSHGGSGKQARAVIDGLEADVVTLALAFDIDEIAKNGKTIDPDWQKEFPDNSTPFISTIVFLVRKGNPKKIKDWDDLVKNGVSVITPNPKTSGGARWNYLAAWGFAKKKYGSDDKALEFVKSLYKSVPVLDAGARGSTTTFVQRGIGDVLIAWENEAYLSINEIGKDKVEIVVPSISILAEPPVAIVDNVVKKHGTEKIAHDYIAFLYTPQAQEIGAQNYYRPQLKEIAEKYKNVFTNVELFSIDNEFGGWQKAHQVHFSDGGIFDKIYQQ